MDESFFCDVCNVHVFSQNFWNDHINGKKHIQMLNKNNKLELLARSSVHLNNFKENSKFNEFPKFILTFNCRFKINEEQLHQIFDKFGEVNRILVDKSGKNSYAIVEFKEEEPARNLLESMQRIKIGKSMVRVRPRKIDFCNLPTKQTSFISNSENTILVTFLLKLMDLLKDFLCRNTLINERLEFAQQLEKHFQKYFSSPLRVLLFGSSSTGLGFVDSDLDLNFIFEDYQLTNKNICSSSSSMSINELDNFEHIQIEDLLKTPMDSKTFLNLTKTNQIRILNNLINPLRKNCSTIISHVPIKDARVPLLRLMLSLSQGKIPCELSVQNLLGEYKANLIETSGLLFHLFFFLKLWLFCNELFICENNLDGLKSHWNSYTILLCTIVFLQKIGLIPPILNFFNQNSIEINGWPVEYNINKFKIENIELPLLLKNLFTFLFLNLKSNKVLSVREGRIIDINDFQKDFLIKSSKIQKHWRFSLVNVQDPIELSHNVASNVGKSSLSKIRWKLSYAISILKQYNNNNKEINCLEKLFKLQKELNKDKKEILNEQEENNKLDDENKNLEDEEIIEEMDIDIN
ncbi:hypothetical protein Mgra_00001797 [Meloidogyne graminicola]|uniref:RRM domain-containing protein n=1 Tax=Meloidogyne graminicola TaxID=189291 RepID=A0A8S9ZZX6_9BILA|nr:hypothetical protein Mgra_00001797 [Meloidogyne graminicola]